MKVIISHDVDHLKSSEHVFKDVYLEKYLARSFLSAVKKKISFSVFVCRLKRVLANRLNNIERLMDFDSKMGIPSVFFFGMNNGLGLSYNQRNAAVMIKKVLARGFDAGVHGIEYLDAAKIKKEHDSFKRISGMRDFGIRNHYIRYDSETFRKMAWGGYCFDSTEFSKTGNLLKNPYKVGNMWEFPLAIMEGYAVEEGAKDNLKKVKSVVKDAREAGIKYLTVLFHDDYFDEEMYPDYYEWYVKLVEYLKSDGYDFISYRDAIKELEDEYADGLNNESGNKPEGVLNE